VLLQLVTVYVTTNIIFMPWPSLLLSTHSFFFWILTKKCTTYVQCSTCLKKKTLVSEEYTFIDLLTIEVRDTTVQFHLKIDCQIIRKFNLDLLCEETPLQEPRASRFSRRVSGFCHLPDGQMKFLRKLFKEIKIQKYMYCKRQTFWVSENDFLGWYITVRAWQKICFLCTLWIATH